jgi:hypothetical protein
MPSKSIQLSEDEADELQRLRAVTGESEEDLLRRAAVRGLHDLRIEQAVLAFENGSGSTEAAKIAGMPRAPFLQLLIDRGVKLLDGPSNLGPTLVELGRRLGDERLIKAGHAVNQNDS